MKKVTTGCVFIVLSFAAACAPAAPTPTRTPEPTPTPAEVRATKAEHLAGIWLYPGEVPYPSGLGGPYYRWDADGTVWRARDPEMTRNLFSRKFGFEEGLYYEDERPFCRGRTLYEVYLAIQGGRAVRLRIEFIEASDPECQPGDRYLYPFVRVD